MIENQAGRNPEPRGRNGVKEDDMVSTPRRPKDNRGARRTRFGQLPAQCGTSRSVEPGEVEVDRARVEVDGIRRRSMSGLMHVAAYVVEGEASVKNSAREMLRHDVFSKRSNRTGTGNVNVIELGTRGCPAVATVVPMAAH